jgi:hypothetical protein
VTWGRVHRPLHLGGLGVLDLRLLGIALRIRWLWLQRADAGQPCLGLPLSADRETKAFFQASTSFVLGDGRSFKFWTNLWVQGRGILELTSELFAVVPPRQRCQHLVADALQDNAWIHDITVTPHVSNLHG